MLGGSLFLLEGVSKGVSLKSERRVERGFSSEGLGDPFFVFVSFVASPLALWNRRLSLASGPLYPTWEENEKYKPGRERRGG